MNVSEQLAAIDRKVDWLVGRVTDLIRYSSYLPLIAKLDIEELKTMSDLTDAVAKLQAKVEADTTVDQSAVTLLGGLTTIINDLKTQVANAADVPAAIAAVNAAASALEANQTGLAAAVTANTPAA